MPLLLVVSLWTSGFVTQTTAAAADGLCQPCVINSDCATNSCSTYGYCLRSCATTSACPTNFSCQSEICQPNNPNSSCNGVWTGVGPDGTCYVSPDDSNGISQLACINGYSCFNFGSTGSCLPSCSPSQSCADTSATCCYGVANGSECSTEQGSAATGSCITVGHVGSSCALPSAALCDSETQCYYLSEPSASACYHTCSSSGTCPTGETCAALADSAGDSINICCQSTSYSPSDPTTCVPQPPACLRNTLVTCGTNADCESGLCLEYKGAKACSTSCSTNSDCPSASQDENGDGKADGGGTCTSINGTSSCWPNDGPVSAPTCANVGNASSGCSCGAMSADSFVWIAALAIASALARRRVRRS